LNPSHFPDVVIGLSLLNLFMQVGHAHHIQIRVLHVNIKS
jgi:ABC-type spermidine/putrescine transport system permease subunit II